MRCDQCATRRVVAEVVPERCDEFHARGLDDLTARRGHCALYGGIPTTRLEKHETHGVLLARTGRSGDRWLRVSSRSGTGCGRRAARRGALGAWLGCFDLGCCDTRQGGCEGASERNDILV